MLRYWESRRGIKNISMSTWAITFNKLDKAIGRFPIIGGQFGYFAYTGTAKYLRENSRQLSKGSDYETLAKFSWIKKQVESNNATVMGMFNHSKYGNHAVLVVGCGNNEWGEYFRVADGWTKSLSTFIKPNQYSLSDAWYFRW